MTGFGRVYFFAGPRPFREQRLRSYIVREHRRGRPLDEILSDPYVARCGNRSLCWRVLCRPDTIEALEGHVREAIASAGAEAHAH